MTLIGWYTMPEGFEARYTPCADGVYWHLYSGSERVNGGIASDDYQAQVLAADYARRYRNDDDCEYALIDLIVREPE